MKLKFPHIFHNWGPWHLHGAGDIRDGHKTIGKYVVQYRTCYTCNLIKHKRTEY